MDSKTILQQFYYEIKNRNGYNPNAEKQQGYAIKKSGSRYDNLKKLKWNDIQIKKNDSIEIITIVGGG